MVYKRIERDQIELPCGKLRKVLVKPKKLGGEIDSYSSSTNVGEYGILARTEKQDNETIHIVSRYMINKCNAEYKIWQDAQLKQGGV